MFKGGKYIKKASIILAIITMIIGTIAFNVSANNSKSYVIDVINAKDLTSPNLDEDSDKDLEASNEDVKVHKQIEKDNVKAPFYDDKNLTYKVSVSNIIEKTTPEIALLLDTSYSVSINDKEVKLKTSAKELVEEIYSTCPDAKIQLFNAAGPKSSKVVLYNNVNNKNNIISAIERLIEGDGSNIKDSLKEVSKSFTAGEKISKYLIVFTDSTDYVKDVLQSINSNEINVIAISIDNITNNSYENTIIRMVYSDSYTEQKRNESASEAVLLEEDEIEDWKLYKEFDATNICNIINNSLLNVKVSDIFSDALEKYFDIEVLTDTEKENVKNTKEGYVWTIDSINRGETKELKYKLIMKDNIDITDTSYKYHKLSVSDEMVIDYEKQVLDIDEEDVKRKFEVKDDFMPVIQICEKYSVTFKAVSEENLSLPIKGVKFNVVATDINNNVVYDSELTTNKDGEVVVDNLKTSGTVHFVITPIIDVNGYDKTDTIEIDITNSNGVGFTMDTPEFQDKFISEENKRNCIVSIPIKTKKFTLELNLTELNNSNAVIGDTEFELIQPTLNNKYTLQARFAETDSEGKAIFYPTVMSQGGKYTYFLSQETVQDGYISMELASITIEFDEHGNIVENGAKVKYGKNITAERKSENYVIVKAQNEAEKEDMFNLELNLADEDDNSKKIQGALYNIEVTRQSAGKEVSTTYYNNITNEKGKINIQLPGNGKVQVKITQVKAPTEYNIDSDPKIVVIDRVNGAVTSVLQAYNDVTKESIQDKTKAYISENKLLVNLTNKIKNERNIIEVNLYDIEEIDVKIPLVELQLVDVETNESYTAITDYDGIARFQIKDKTQGQHQYKLSVIGTMPNCYESIPEISINIRFDENNHICEANDLWGDSNTEENPLDEIGELEVLDNEGFADYKITLNVGAIVNQENTYYFQVELKDRDDQTPLEGASYDITITSGDIVRTIKGRKTDAQGHIQTKLILNKEITIEVTEIETISKYKIDRATKEINLRYDKTQNQLTIEGEEPDVSINGQNFVVYSHKNAKKTTDDVLLDLTINKEDINGFAAGNLPIRIYQETHGDNSIIVTKGELIDGIEYGTWIEASGESLTPKPFEFEEGEQEEEKDLNITTKTDDLGTVVLKGLKINGVPENGDAEFILYVAEVDETTHLDKQGTIVKYKITYRYNESKEIVEITNVETTLGNRLIKEKTFNGYESAIGYQSNIFTTIYTNYDDVGNLALDLHKVDRDGNVLVGAQYTINVVRPDSSRLSRNVEVKDGTIEILGLMTTEGTQIEITETKAPIGYALNQATEVLEVKKIEEETGELTLEVISNNYKEKRIELKIGEVSETTSGIMKTQYDVTLTDYELDTFRMRIIAKDSKTEEPVEGYSFKIETSKGAQKITQNTNSEGITEETIGGNYSNQIVTYDITSNQSSRYYKDIEKIQLSVIFDNDQNVAVETTTSQTDLNHGELSEGKKWKVKNINVLNERTNEILRDIEIEVYIDTDDPLEVEIETIDAVSNQTLSNQDITYTITPSFNIPGTGTIDPSTNKANIEIGYVERNSSRDYLLKTEVPDNYETMPDIQFNVVYDKDGNIHEVKTEETEDLIKIESKGNKKVVIKVYVEPKQGIQIENTNPFDDNKEIIGAQFEITCEDEEKTTLTLETGKASMLGEKHGNSEKSYIYKVHQITPSKNFAKVQDFEIKVKYDNERKVTGVEFVNKDNHIDKLVELSVINDYTSEEPGYNGNDKGIVKIKVKSYYDFRVEIENVDRLENTKKIVGTQYEVTSTKDTSGNAETNEQGLGVAHLDEVKINEKVTYTIKEVAPSIDYQPLENEIKITVEFDDNGYVKQNTINIENGTEDVHATAKDMYTEGTNDDLEKFTIHVQITNLPKFRVEIKNIDKFHEEKTLSGAKYSINSSVGNSIDVDNEKATDQDGNVTLRVDGNPTNDVIYTIHEENASEGYQSIEQDIQIKVVFGEDGSVINCSIEQGSNFAEAQAKVKAEIETSQNETFDKLTIEVTIKSVELLKFKLHNIYEKTESGETTEIPLAHATYKISAIKEDAENLEVDNANVTDAEGNTTIGMDRALSNQTIKYVITQEQSAIGYKRLDYEIIVKVTFTAEGKIQDQSCSIVTNDKNESATNFANIESVDIENFTINVKIKSNKLVDFVINNISTEKDEDTNKVISTSPVVNTTFVISAQEKEKAENLEVDNKGTSDISGHAKISMDRGLASKTIQYTIREEKKAVGYEWLDCEIIIEVQFDANGKIIKDSTKIGENSQNKSANGFVKIKNVDLDNYEIEIEIENTPIKEFGIHLVAKDMYTEAPINGVKANAYLAANDKDNNTLVSDGKYDFSVLNAKKEEFIEESYRYLYTGVDRNGDGQKDVADGEDYLSMGKYLEGDNKSRVLRIVLMDVPAPYQWYANNTDARQEYAIVIDLTFDDEGKIVSQSLREGHNSYIGWQADHRYVIVDSTGYGLTIRLNFYPMLYVKMEAQDMYTEDVLESRLHLSTSEHKPGLNENEYIKEGYIGYSGDYHPEGEIYSVYSSHNYEKAARAEAKGERIFYLFEETTPNEPYYQRFRPRYYKYYYSTQIGSIKVTYDEAGRIKDAVVLDYKSSNNIEGSYIDLSWEDEYNLSIKVKYVPTTNMVVKVVDRVTETPLNNIKIYPFNEGKQRYQYYYSEKGYETTSTTGEAGWTYWGANEKGTNDKYVLRTQFVGSEYNGYYLPGDIKLDVAYSETGKIASAQVVSQNIFNDALNAEVSKIDDTTLYLTIKLDRKFNLKIDKKDLFDSNINLNAKFEIKSSKHEDFTIYAWKTETVGRVHPGEIVTYELKEIDTPDGYLPFTNLKVYVQFNYDGTVERAYVGENYQKYFVEQAKAGVETGKKGVNTTDLEIIVKDKPTLKVDLELTDAFYHNLKLKDAIFTLKNNKGESASGSLVTNENGMFSTIIGEVYPGETITYTLKQTSAVNTYKIISGEMKFTIKYNENGKIEEYNVTEQSGTLTIKPQIYNNGRYVKLEVINISTDINIGIVKTDENTGNRMDNVKFNVEITEGQSKEIKEFITANNADGSGTIAGKIDDIQSNENERRTVIYKISEVKAANTYRKIQDIVLEVTFATDGSIANYEILSNDSDVDVKVFTKGSNITKLNGIPTHIRLDIKNDNRYDIIIKDEDTHYEGLGIQGTTYNVSVNGVPKNLPATNENGLTGLYKLDESGQIKIVVSEIKVGTGYRDDETNKAEIIVNKGTGEYSLKLDEKTVGYVDETKAEYPNEHGVKAIIEVNEEKGTITITFKNETKFELDVAKADYLTNEPMSGIEFEITAQEIENGEQKGEPKSLENISEIITGEAIDNLENGLLEDSVDSELDDTETQVKTYKTNDEGRLYFDFGRTPQNKTIQFTFKERTKLEDYNPLEEVKVIAKFDQYGHIQQLTGNSYLVATQISNDNVNGIIVLIKNRKITDITTDAEYTIKVATEDSVTNKRINDSKVDIVVSKNDGIEVAKKQGETTKDFVVGGLLIEKGVITLNGLTAEGEINIEIDQKGLVEGYEFSDKTSGIVKVKVSYADAQEGQNENIIKFEKVDDDGFNVILDETNREIIIEIKNDPVVTLNINKYFETYELNEENETIKEEKPVEGAKFTITSEIQTSKETIATELSKDTKSTDAQGNTTTSIGKPYAGKTITYTIKETPAEGYDTIDDVVILVKYDSSGNIKYTEVLSDQDFAEVTSQGKGTKEFSIKIKNLQSANKNTYKIILRKHSIYDGEYDYLLPDTEYQFAIKEEYGTEKTWLGFTNEEGEITSQSFSGYGRINIDYKELTAAPGYQLDSEEHHIEFARDKITGVFRIITADENYNFDEENGIVYLDPQNDLQYGKFDFIINKIDAETNKRITGDTTIFDVSLIETQQIVNQSINEEGNVVETIEEKEVELPLGTIETDDQGRAKLTAVQMPETEGTYKLKIYEQKAPEGYEKHEIGYLLSVTFAKNENEDMEIAKIENLSTNEIEILKEDKQLLAINFKDYRESINLKENEFALKVTKVDSETKEAIRDNLAIFRLTDENGNKQYIETDKDYAELQIPYMLMPTIEDFEDGQETIIRNYELVEVMAPEGYLVDMTPINVKIVFAKDVDNNITIQNVEVTKNTESEEDIEIIESTIEDRVIAFNIENEKGELINNEDRGTYTINIEKVDSETDKPITKHATFEITLENGQKLTASTDEEGNIKIEDIKVPLTITQNLGPYTYIIKETKAAEGYELIDGYSIMELTFKELVDEETGKNTGMYGIDNVEHIPTLTRSQSAEITSYTESEVNLKVKNKAKEEELYIKTKEYIISDEERYVEDAKLEENIYEEGDKYIIGLNPRLTVESEDTETEWTKGTKLETFIENIETNAESIKIYNEEEQEIAKEDYIGTNMIVEFTKGEKVVRLVLIVRGDLNGDGILNLNDTTKAKRYIKNDDESILDTTEKKIAYDVNFDGKLNMKDTNNMQRAQANDDVRELDE